MSQDQAQDKLTETLQEIKPVSEDDVPGKTFWIVGILVSTLIIAAALAFSFWISS